MDNFEPNLETNLKPDLEPTKKRHKRPFPILFFILVAILLSVTIYRFFSNINLPWIIKNYNALRKAGEITRLIDDNFYQDPTEESLENGIYRGLVDSLSDPYSQYFTAEEWKEFNIQTTGKYAGIGARLSQDQKTKVVTIMEVYDDSPAKDAGLKAGDIIVSADEFTAEDMELSVFVQHLRGEKNTTVDVVYKRGDKTEKVTITRREVFSPSVYYNMLDEDTGYLQITQFEENTLNEFKNAISSMEKDGMKDIVYDLRSNPGGLVSSVTAILDEMLPKGTIVYLEDKHGNRKTYNSDEEHKMDYPCVVLINEGSASSSEIFAGAVKDYNYGKLVGTKTFGKGIVQNTFLLSDGSAIKLTVSEYFTPNGHNIHGAGLEPDVTLEYKFMGKEGEEYSQINDNQLMLALHMLNEK